MNIEKNVVIIGAGVAGLTAADELSKKGYKITIYENSNAIGGKAITYFDNGLPGEHGFHIFPDFYVNLFETLKSIPINNSTNYLKISSNNVKSYFQTSSKSNVYNHLTPANKDIFALPDATHLKINKLKTIIDLFQIIIDFFIGVTRYGFLPGLRFIFRWLSMAITSKERAESYDNITFANYMKSTSDVVKSLVSGLIAAQINNASTFSGILSAAQLQYGLFNPFRKGIQVLDGQASEIWFDSWLKKLTKQGVKINYSQTLTDIIVIEDKIQNLVITNSDGKKIMIKADKYIIAIPVDKITPIVNKTVLKNYFLFNNLNKLTTRWMLGIQLYYKEKIDVTEGHCLCMFSPWSLTFISQKQFW
jgi:uncharacterized protein with NAD-binding domain and iron-sulfur cluster